MSSLALNSDNDLCFEDFRLKTVSSNDEIVQKVRVRLRFFKGEWFLNTEHGIPYFQDILGQKEININIIQQIFKQNILEINGITSIIEFELDYNSASRELTLDFKAATDNGIIDEIITV